MSPLQCLVAQLTAVPGSPTLRSPVPFQLLPRLQELGLWMFAAVAAAVPVAMLAWPLMSVLISMARATTCVSAAAVLLEVEAASVSASASAAAVAARVVVEFAAAETVVADLAAAAVVVVAAVSAALAAAAVLMAPSLAGPRSVPPRELKSWLRDKSLGRALRLWLRPSLQFRLRIPEPRCPHPDSFLVDSEPEYRRAEAVSEFLEEPGQLTQEWEPSEEPC